MLSCEVGRRGREDRIPARAASCPGRNPPRILPITVTKEGHPMFHPTETKLQSWRAVAVFEDGREGLLRLGRSSVQVRGGYAQAYAELLDRSERSRVRDISLQCWQGAAD